MATRPSPRSSDGTRPRSSRSGVSTGSGRPPSSPRTSGDRTPGRSSASDKPMPSFLRPTVSSSLHSSTSSSSLTPPPPPSSKGRRSADKAPALVEPRPITPKVEKPKAAPASTSRWSGVSPKQLMQKASNAIKGTKSRSKTTKEAAGPANASSSSKAAVRPASSSSGKEATRPAASSSSVRLASSKEAAGSASSEAKGQTARAEPLEEQPDTPAVQTEEAVREPKAEQIEQHAAAPQQVAPADDITGVEERGQTEVVSVQQPAEESEQEVVIQEGEKHVVEEMNVETPEPEQQEQKLETEAEAAQMNTGDELPAVAVQEAAEEAATPAMADEPVVTTAEARVVEDTKVDERQQEEAIETEYVVENSGTCVISEEHKEETSLFTEEPKKEETSVISEEPKLEEASVISDEPKNEETSVISEEPKLEEASVISDELKKEEASLISEEHKNVDTSVISEEPNEESRVISEEPKDETDVISEELKEETSIISEEQKEETSSTIAEEPKEETSLIPEQSQEDPAPVEKLEEVANTEAQASEPSSASAPTTPVKDALGDVEAVTSKQVSASEPVTPVQEQAVSKDKAVIETLLSASAPATPARSVEKKVTGVLPGQTTTTAPEESSKLPFKGSKVKTAMEKRSEEEQPKKKEVARSNDVIEETKSKLLEKRKSKVKALVGAFETVMDSPRG